MPRKKQYISSDLSAHEVVTRDTLCSVLDCSLSHVVRLMRGEIKTATPFPKFFRMGTRILYWRRTEITAWLDEQQAADAAAK
jgi:predicted DNA-binding transcriptional regulator AlpA